MAVERAAAPTVDDVFRLAERGLRYEIVDGELVEMSPVGFDHSDIALTAAARFREDVRRERLGKVVASETLFRLDPNTRWALAPDIAFVRRERVPPTGQNPGAFEGPPDLAVEVQSPSDRVAAMRRKARHWLDAGTQIVVLLLTKPPRVEVHRTSGVSLAQGDETVDLSPVLPSLPARELFPD